MTTMDISLTSDASQRRIRDDKPQSRAISRMCIVIRTSPDSAVIEAL